MDDIEKRFPSKFNLFDLSGKRATRIKNKFYYASYAGDWHAIANCLLKNLFSIRVKFLATLTKQLNVLLLSKVRTYCINQCWDFLNNSGIIHSDYALFSSPAQIWNKFLRSPLKSVSTWRGIFEPSTATLFREWERGDVEFISNLSGLLTSHASELNRNILMTQNQTNWSDWTPANFPTDSGYPSYQ